jgi:hypothetical protein
VFRGTRRAGASVSLFSVRTCQVEREWRFCDVVEEGGGRRTDVASTAFVKSMAGEETECYGEVLFLACALVLKVVEERQ